MMHIVFWQRMLSPHMMGLAEATATTGAAITFVATERLSEARREQGWEVSDEGKVERRLISDTEEAARFIAKLPQSTFHITQGLRGNAEIGTYQKMILAAQQRLWVILETVDPGGWRAPLKKALYSWKILRLQKNIDGVLAIGAGTSDWLVARGFPKEKVFPFAYFVDPVQPPQEKQTTREKQPFTFAYIGNLESWKNPMLALEAFITLQSGPRKLVVAGGGSLRSKLETRAKEAPPEVQIEFLGRVQMAKVPELMTRVDCLILPSNVDGWGVVASEAMLLGTPTIVSDACGVRAAVHAAPQGGVFPARDLAALQSAMRRAQSEGRDEDRRATLKAWSSTLGADYGAEYLLDILSGSRHVQVPDWLRNRRASS